MNNPPLGKIRVAAPCNAEWKWMYGDDRVRFCGQCSKNVFNLSAMTTEEAEDLIRRAEGSLCVRFYRRRDGSILTENCPVGLNGIRHQLTRTRTHIIAAVVSFLGYLGLLGLSNLTLLKDADPRPVMGAIATPRHLPSPGIAVKSESFIRERAIFKVIPVYHSATKLNGTVVVRLFIDEDGSIDEAGAMDGNPLLKDLAEGAARQWRFEPFFVNGEPVRVESRLTFRFGKD